MKIRVSDPLALLPYQTGILRPPLDKKAAEGDTASNLDTNQRAVQLGDPVPIVFGKYVDVPGTDSDYGGVFIDPPAVNGNYADVSDPNYNPDLTANVLSIQLIVVLSQGVLGEITVRDIYQRACKKGTVYVFYQSQNSFNINPGNIIDYTDLWVCPSYCGTADGTYEDLTMMRYSNKYAPGDDSWTRQVYVFVRNGIKVPRIIEGDTDSSNNMIDLALYLIRQTSRVPELLIDTAASLIAARFIAVNGFTWDGIIKESYNLEDWMKQMASYFLLRVSDNNGKKGFRPRLPLNGDYTINTGTINWVYGFTEEHILPDGFQIEYIPLSERKPICAQMLWRQQPPNDVGFIRSTEVRIDGEAVDGPFEQFDMSQFCTRENHAVKVGAYEVARRKYVTHSLRIRVKPDSFNTTLTLGDIVRVQLRRENDPGVVTFHDYLYEVEKINKTQSGVVELDLMHFPIDALGRSILALYVAGAEGTGYLYDLGRGTYTCDDPDNTTNTDPVPTDSGEPNPDAPDTDVNLPPPGTDVDNPPDDTPVFLPDSDTPTNYPPTGVPTLPNPDDSFVTDSPGGDDTIDELPSDRPFLPGDILTYTPPCCPAEVLLYAIDYDTGVRLQEAPVAVGTAIVGDCEVRFEILSEYLFDTATAFEFTHRCVDPGSPDGYNVELPGGTTPLVAPCDTVRTYSNDSTALESYAISASGFTTNVGSISGISVYIKYDTEFCAGEGQFRLWYRGQSIVDGEVVTNEAALHDFCFNAGAEATVMSGLQVYKDGSLLGSEFCDSLLNDPGLNEAPADDYRIATPIYDIGFTTTEANPWFVIGSTNNGCGENTIRTLTYVTGEPNVSTSSWGVCASPIFSAPGQYYGTLYRRRPGTVGPGLNNFDPVRDLYFP